MVTAFTIITRNYLHQARAVMESVAEQWPEAQRCVILVDRPEDLFSPEEENFEIIFADALGLPNFRQKAFALDGVSMCCLLKPAAALHLLNRSEIETLVYFDGDTLLYRQPVELVSAADRFSVVFSPHLVEPAPFGKTRRDFHFMQAGLINGGLFAVKNRPAGKVFLRWWLANLDQPHHLDADWAYDQGWLNLAPGYFPDFGVLRHLGYNVGYWNLDERSLSVTTGQTLVVNGTDPLTLFHFSCLNPDTPGFVANRGGIEVLASGPVLREVVQNYIARLNRLGREQCRSWTYAFGHFRDGAPITHRHRSYYRYRFGAAEQLEGDPFDPSYAPGSARGLKSLYNVGHPLTRLLRRLQRTKNALLGPEPYGFE
jgi:hypothetical protein